MPQTVALFATLKKALRAQGVTYRDVAHYLGHSEANVKRMFSENNMPVDRLEQICQMIDLEISDLVRKMEADTQKISALTENQEQELVSDPKLLLVAFLVVNAWTFDEILSYYNLEKPELIRLLVQLDRLKLVELLPNNRIKLLASKQFAWRTNGPIQHYFSKNMQDDYFTSPFDRDGEKFRFMSGLLSVASSQKLNSRIEQLAGEYNRLVIEDQKLPLEERYSFSMILAIRPWHPKAFSQYLRQHD
ncbi:MAG: transcriptional regulator [Gammaproteobacteria bacterium SG8_11]|nr:MAG: transcriptional regulator [Gammaproteobacteria bacterium SG8_11]